MIELTDYFEIIKNLKAITGMDTLLQLELYDLTEKDRSTLYEQCRAIDNGGKYIVSIFNGSTILGQAEVIKEYKIEYEICLPQRK